MPRLFALVVSAAAVIAGCGGGSEASSRGDDARARATVRDLSTVLELRAAFNEDRGSPRLLLLLSPT
jgi:hypothetical protein